MNKRTFGNLVCKDGLRDDLYRQLALSSALYRRTGLFAYLGDGANRWPAMHRQDAATLSRLAIERAPAGSTL